MELGVEAEVAGVSLELTGVSLELTLGVEREVVGAVEDADGTGVFSSPQAAKSMVANKGSANALMRFFFIDVSYFY